jgi:hypothetical protein
MYTKRHKHEVEIDLPQSRSDTKLLAQYEDFYKCDVFV